MLSTWLPNQLSYRISQGGVKMIEAYHGHLVVTSSTRFCRRIISVWWHVLIRWFDIFIIKSACKLYSYCRAAFLVICAFLYLNLTNQLPRPYFGIALGDSPLFHFET